MSTPIWGNWHKLIIRIENDSKVIVIASPNWSTHVCSSSSLSRGAWNRAIFARYMDWHCGFCTQRLPIQYNAFGLLVLSLCFCAQRLPINAMRLDCWYWYCGFCTQRLPIQYNAFGLLVFHVATKKLRDFAPTKASIDWVLTFGKEFTKSFKSFLSTVKYKMILKNL